MKPTDTGKAYDTLTHLWQSERFNLDNGMTQHRRALRFVQEAFVQEVRVQEVRGHEPSATEPVAQAHVESAPVKNNDPAKLPRAAKKSALDVGCGCTGRFIDLLLAEGFEPEGVDISAKMIELARQRHPQLSFYHEDICQWKLPRQYDFITAWDSIWHVPLEQQRLLLDKLAAALKPGGALIFSFGGVETAGAHTDDYMGPEVYYSSLGTNGALAWLLDAQLICRHLEYDQYPELHTYVIAQKPTHQANSGCQSRNSRPG